MEQDHIYGMFRSACADGGRSQGAGGSPCRGHPAVWRHVAFSASTIGVGVVTGGPYNCAFVNPGGILTCMQGTPLGVASWHAALGFAALGQIDPVANLQRQRVYLFSGTRDVFVSPSVVDATSDFFLAAQVPQENLVYTKNFAAGHAFISDLFGSPCDTNGAPFINKCPDADLLYDQPRAVLQHIYGPLQDEVTTLSAQPVAFDQTEFKGARSSKMDEEGFVYIPRDCQTGGCAVHVVFHGCLQGASEVGDGIYGQLGYNQWADTNRIIVLYPQVKRSQFFPFNPNGCWDWWGYSGTTFQTRSGAQLAAVNAMVQRLGESIGGDGGLAR